MQESIALHKRAVIGFTKQWTKEPKEKCRSTNHEGDKKINVCSLRTADAFFGGREATTGNQRKCVCCSQAIMYGASRNLSQDL